MRHNLIIINPEVIIDTSFSNNGKNVLYTSRDYPLVNLNLELSDNTLIENDNGFYNHHNDYDNDNSIIKNALYYDILLYIDTSLYNKISSGIIYSNNIPDIPLPLKDGILDVKNIPIIFDDLDKVKKQNGNELSIIFDEIIPVKSCSIYWTETNDFDCYCSPSFTQINDFQVNCSTSSDFGFIYGYSGSNVKVDIIPTLLVNFSSGENVATDLNYKIQYNIHSTSGYGENYTNRVQYNYRFSPSISFGENVTSIISTRPQYAIVSTSLYGENYTNKVQHNYRFSPSIGYGENSRATLAYAISEKFTASVSDGSSFNGSIFYSVSNNILASFYVGDTSVTNIGIKLALAASVKTGENTAQNVTTSTTIYPNVFSGDTLRNTNTFYKGMTVLNSLTQIGDNVYNSVSVKTSFNVNIGAGENVTNDIKNAEGIRSSTNAYTGETSSFSLVNSVFFSPIVSVGENSSFTLTGRAAYNLDPKVSIGESFSGGGIALSPSLQPRISNGEMIKPVTVTNLPNWYISVGETLSTNLAITKSFDGNRFSSGENTTLSLKYSFSEPVGIFTVSSGEDLYCELDTLVSTTFTSVSSFSTDFTPTIWDTTYIDLNRNNGCCLPRKEDLLYVNLQRDKEVELDYSVKDKLQMVTELSVVRLFNIDVRTGENLKVDEYKNYFEVDFYHGSSTKAIDLYMDLDVNLSNGNLDYNGSLFIETFKEYQSIKTAHNTSFTGESVEFELSTYENLQPSATYGSRLDSSLWTVEAWRVGFHGNAGGVRATLNTTIKIYPRINIGDSVRGTFYEQPYILGTGENVTCDLVLDFDVEFLEDGCLENTHIPTDKDGVPIIDPMNEMVVEGYYYSRFIKGRCY